MAQTTGTNWRRIAATAAAAVAATLAWACGGSAVLDVDERPDTAGLAGDDDSGEAAGGAGAVAGTSASHPVACPPGLTSCDGKCVDPATDWDNCGGCGAACGGGTVCCGGECVDTATDGDNCGACGQACEPGWTTPTGHQCGAQICSSGMCALDCAGDTCVCGGKCVDVMVDPANCGDCGIECGPGEICSAGKCTFSCAGGTTKCGKKCVDTNLDPENCGGCGNACQPGQSCQNGGCQ
ncbi:MAG: hypothetical protein HY744_18605 [Deltaproteobacteria bacterium]|nr:hypothetical protein [Deltaproteobacteria bacterium]